MRIYLVRHGIAVDRDDPQCPPDAERPLTGKGRQRSRDVARGLARQGISPGAMYASPLVRAVETAEIFARELRFPSDRIQQTDAMLPDTNPAAMLRVLAKEKADDVCCFGHAPHIDALLARLVGSPHVITSLKKAGVACIEIDSLRPFRGRLVWLAVPGQFRM